MNRLPPLGEMWRDRVFQVAALAGVVALAAFVAATIGAVRLQAVTPVSPPPAIPDSLLRFAPPDAGPDVSGAVARDLFQEDRTPAPRRYRLPGEADVPPSPPAQRPVVLGTAMGTGDSDFAICQVPGAQPVIVRAGARIGEFTVLSIERARVWFRGADGERFAIDAGKPVP